MKILYFTLAALIGCSAHTASATGTISLSDCAAIFKSPPTTYAGGGFASISSTLMPLTDPTISHKPNIGASTASTPSAVAPGLSYYYDSSKYKGQSASPSVITAKWLDKAKGTTTPIDWSQYHASVVIGLWNYPSGGNPTGLPKSIWDCVRNNYQSGTIDQNYSYTVEGYTTSASTNSNALDAAFLAATKAKLNGSSKTFGSGSNRLCLCTIFSPPATVGGLNNALTTAPIVASASVRVSNINTYDVNTPDINSLSDAAQATLIKEIQNQIAFIKTGTLPSPSLTTMKTAAVAPKTVAASSDTTATATTSPSTSALGSWVIGIGAACVLSYAFDWLTSDE